MVDSSWVWGVGMAWLGGASLGCRICSPWPQNEVPNSAPTPAPRTPWHFIAPFPFIDCAKKVLELKASKFDPQSCPLLKKWRNKAKTSNPSRNDTKSGRWGLRIGSNGPRNYKEFDFLTSPGSKIIILEWFKNDFTVDKNFIFFIIGFALRSSGRWLIDMHRKGILEACYMRNRPYNKRSRQSKAPTHGENTHEERHELATTKSPMQRRRRKTRDPRLREHTH